ncbi:MAG: pyridoxal phosphate-dependent aminotransferase [Methylococcaceae bacterium]|nr:pyridoxal phosphate-dependent aminotransferase [Methylococcaceae bacterium]
MRAFDFDRPIERRGTSSVKFDGCAGYFGTEDVLPLWVADMDFAVPEAVSQALQARASHPVFGYTLHPESMHQAMLGWMRRRHGWEIQRDWAVYTPGVVPALHAAVMAFTEPGDGVIVQSPVYYPFFTAVTLPGRRLLLNPLELQDGCYRMNLAHFEQLAADGARLMFLCSPHNPVGRVWRADELEALLALCRRHGITVLSDEIHHDLVYPGHSHLPLARLADNAEDIVTAVAPSKTFNIPGLGLSALIVPCPRRRAALRKVMDQVHMTAGNPFSIAAFEAAYREGDAWLDALLAYLDETRRVVAAHIAGRLAPIRAIEPEGTYLLWLDCSGLGLDDGALKRFFIDEARVGLNPGIVFGEGGSGFMRMNLGAPRSRILEALDRIETALRARD